MSLVQEGREKSIRMGYLAVVGSHSINGVSELHTKLLKESMFRDFYDIFPQRFNNKTNGITPRRWLLKANPELSSWITDKIGKSWITNLDELRKLEPFVKNREDVEDFYQIKRANKVKFCRFIQEKTGTLVSPDAIFDSQIKRFHEYKRQLLNLLNIIHLYLSLKDNPNLDLIPRVFIFAGKAAPAYTIAKLIIRLVNAIAKVINSDESIQDKIKVIFLPDYGVSLAEVIIPSTDVSEQISTAGMEASGTGNMKLALNGALTVGTLDGANVEMREEVGEENIFIFGLKAHEVAEHKKNGTYNSYQLYESDPTIKRVVDFIFSNFFCLHEPGLFNPLRHVLLEEGDRYFVLADFHSYVECQNNVDQLYRDHQEWNKKAIFNVARMGKFSSDSVIQQYANEIWKVYPAPIDMKDKKNNTVMQVSDQRKE
jgi:starch phosphorylase